MLRAWTLLAATLVLAPLSYAADVPAMTGANYIFRTQRALCSATLISKSERWALTNEHCIEDAVRMVEREEIQADGTVKKVTRPQYDEVTLSQPAYGDKGRVGELTLRAEIVAFSKPLDLAVLRVLSETIQFPAVAKLPADDYKLVQGQVVWAIGNPIGLENTVTRGILSHLYREIEIGADKMRYIQTDAAIAGGSSGGSLYSDEGYLIGIPSAGFRGAAMNFAIPYTIFKKFLSDNGFARVWDPQAPSREEFLKAKSEKKKPE